MGDEGTAPPWQQSELEALQWDAAPVRQNYYG